MKTYTILGTTDSETTCQLCGRNDLKSTVVLRETETSLVVYFGSECAARAAGWTVKEVETKIKEARAVKLAEQSAKMAAETKTWETWLAERTGAEDTFTAIQILGGFSAARQMYREAA